MKKLLALLLALLLPVGALAETVSSEDSNMLSMELDLDGMQSGTFCLEAAVTADEDILAAYLQPSMYVPSDGTATVDAASMAAAAAKLINGLGFKMVAQNDAVMLEMLLRGSSLMDFTVYSDDETETMTSSLMPGYAVMQNAEDEVLSESDYAQIMQVFGGMFTAGMQQLEDVEYERTCGSFAGDAYSGGVWCTTVRLDDADIAAFLKAMMTDEFRDFASDFLVANDLGSEETLQLLDATHDAVAQANEHQYILHFVENAVGEPVGFSAVVMRGEKQLRTFSLGLKDQSLRIVTGCGDAQQNYWYDYVILMEEQTDGVTIAGSCIEFTSAKDEAFSYALATNAEYPVWREWRLNVKTEGSDVLIRYDEEGAIDPTLVAEGMPAEWRIEGEAQIASTTAFGELHCYSADKEWLTVNASLAACEEIAPLSADLILADMDSEDPAQQDLAIEATSLLTANLSQRMLTIIPLDVMLVLIRLVQ